MTEAHEIELSSAIRETWERFQRQVIGSDLAVRSFIQDARTIDSPETYLRRFEVDCGEGDELVLAGRLFAELPAHIARLANLMDGNAHDFLASMEERQDEQARAGFLDAIGHRSKDAVALIAGLDLTKPSVLRLYRFLVSVPESSNHLPQEVFGETAVQFKNRLRICGELIGELDILRTRLADDHGRKVDRMADCLGRRHGDASIFAARGHLALFKAALHYDARRGYRFWTYARHWVRRGFELVMEDKQRDR